MGAVKLTLAGFVLLGLALFFISEEAEAISPEWDYDAGNDVFDVAVSSDGNYIAVGTSGADDKVYLFDKDSSSPLWSYEAGGMVRSVAISADGEYVVAGSWDEKIYLFDKDSDTPLWHYTTDGELYSVSISAGGEYIVAGNEDDELYLFNKDSNTPIWTYSAGDAVYSVSISADGKYIAVGSFDGKVYLFNKNSSTPLWSYGIGGQVWSVSISADGEYITAGGQGDKVYFFDKDSSTPIWSYDTGEDLLSVEISANGEYIVAGGVGDNWKVYFFGTDNSTPLWIHTAGNVVRSVDISANGTYIIAGSNDNKIYLFGKNSNIPLGRYTTGDDVNSVAISDNGLYLAAGSNDNKVYAFDERKFPEWSFETDDNVEAVAVSADGEYIAVGSYDDKVYLFDKDSSTPLWSYTTGDDVESVAISADGEYIAVGSYDDKVYLFDKGSSTPLWSYTTGGNARSVAISADGAYIAVGSIDDKVYLFSKNSSTPLWNYTTGGNVYWVSISADGEYIAVGSHDDKVYLFDKDSGTPLWSYTTGSNVYSVAISADGEYIAVGSSDEKVYLFDKDSSTPLWTYDTEDIVYTVSISADGKYIAAGTWSTGDTKVYLFDKENSTPLWSYETAGTVWSIAASADGEYIVAGTLSDAYQVYLFDKDSNTPLWSYDTEDYVYAVSISADGKYIAAGGPNDKAYLLKNSLADRLSVIPYGPSDEITVTNPVNLNWFSGSDDNENLTFDLYLGTTTGILPTSFFARVNNTIPITEYITDIEYHNGYLWFSERDNFSIKKINLENDEISVFATDTTYLKQVSDFTIDSSGNLYTVSRSDTIYASSTYVCKWLVDGTRSNCNTSNDVRYGTSIDYYNNSIFVLQTGSHSSTQKIIELSSSSMESIDSHTYSGGVWDIAIDQNTGDIWFPNKSSGTVQKLDASDNYEQETVGDSGMVVASSIEINDGYAYIFPYASNTYNGTIKRVSLSGTSFEDYNYNFTYKTHLGQATFDDDGNLYLSTDLRSSHWSNANNLIYKLSDVNGSPVLVDYLGIKFSNASFENLTVNSFNITSYLTPGETYVWQIVAKDSNGFKYSEIKSFYVHDDLAPITSLKASEPLITSNQTIDFFISTDQDGSYFKCKLDEESWYLCGSFGNGTGGHVGGYFRYHSWDGSHFTAKEGRYRGDTGTPDYSNLSFGNHSFAIYAVDVRGNAGPIVYWNWTIYDVELNENPELTDYNVSPNPAFYKERVYFYSNFSDSDGHIEQYSWRSSIDGLLSNNGNFSTDDLSLGNHTIFLRAKDNYGFWSENTTFWLDIEQNIPVISPNVMTITPSVAPVGTIIEFSSFLNGSSPESIAWISDIDGNLSSQISFQSGNLSVGNHLITLKYRFSGGSWFEINSPLLVFENIDLISPNPNNQITLPNTFTWESAGDDLVYDFYLDKSCEDSKRNYCDYRGAPSKLFYEGDYIWFGLRYENYSSVEKININTFEKSVFITGSPDISEIFDITISNGYLYSLSIPFINEIPNESYSYTKICKWNLTTSDLVTCNDTSVLYGTAISHYEDELFILQSNYTISSSQKVVILDSVTLQESSNFSLYASGLTSFEVSSDLDVDQNNGNIFILFRDNSGTVRSYNRTSDGNYQDYRSTNSGAKYSTSIAISESSFYVSSYFYSSNYGGLKSCNIESLACDRVGYFDSSINRIGSIAVDENDRIFVVDSWLYANFDYGTNLGIFVSSLSHYMAGYNLLVDSKYSEYQLIASNLTETQFYLTKDFSHDSNTTYNWFVVGKKEDRLIFSEFREVWFIREGPVIEDFSVTPRESNYGDRVSFNINCTSEDGEIVSIIWESVSASGENLANDGFLSNSASFSTESLSPGDHLIVVFCYDDMGLSASENEDISVYESNPGSQKPELQDYNAYPLSTDYSEKISFFTNFTDLDGLVVNYEWVSSLDGLISNQKEFTNYNLSVGTHMITLRAQDNEGQWSDYTQFFIVIYDREGCTDSSALNFDPNATSDDGSCEHGSSEDCTSYNLSGNIYVHDIFFNDADLGIGDGSFHFISEQEAYFFSRTMTFADGELTPRVNYFTEISYDKENRIFRGKIDWTNGGTTTLLGGEAYYIYELVFSSNFQYIENGLLTTYLLNGEVRNEYNYRSPDFVGNGLPNIQRMLYQCSITAQDYELQEELEIDDNSDDLSFSDVMFYLPPEGQILLPENLSTIFGIIVDTQSVPDANSLDQLSGLRLCLETGGPLDNYLYNYFGERGMNYNPLEATGDMGQTFFTGRFCPAWISEYDNLVEFDNSYEDSFERQLLNQTISINFTEEKSIFIDAEYNLYNGVKTDRQSVNIRSWDYFSSINNTITINYAEFWLQDLENGDDSCIWTFRVHKTGILQDEVSVGCKSISTILSSQIYQINIPIEVSEGDHIQIELIYEGWNDLMLFYGSEMHPSGFSISGIIDETEVIDEEIEEDKGDSIDEVTPDTENSDVEVTLPFELNALTIGLITAAAGLVAAAFAEAGARQSVTKIIDELQALVDAGVTDSDLNKSIEELENIEGFRYLSNDRTEALELLNSYNEVQGQALGAMQQLDELESVVAELEAAGVSSPELGAEIAEIQSMLQSQLVGDTSEDYSNSLFEQFKQNKGGN